MALTGATDPTSDHQRGPLSPITIQTGDKETYGLDNSPKEAFQEWVVSAEPVDQTVGMIDTNYLLSGHRQHSEDKGKVAKQWAFLQIRKKNMLLFSDIP